MKKTNSNYYYNGSRSQYPNQSEGSRFFILRTEKGQIFVDPTVIRYIWAGGNEAVVKQSKPVYVPGFSPGRSFIFLRLPFGGVLLESLLFRATGR
jgi:hypothetical protein